MRQLFCGQKSLLLLLLLLSSSSYFLSPLCKVFTIIYVSETTHVSRVHSDADVLYVQFVLHVMLLRT